MEEKINIVEILKDKPQGTKLYSSACGKCKLEEVDDKSFKISFYSSKFGFMNGGEGYLDKNGKLCDDGECVVFPSKEMRDWRKFAWKKGDVLVSNDGKERVIFVKFQDNRYMRFFGKFFSQRKEDGDIDYKSNLDASVNDYTLENMDAAQTYIKAVEERCGGKLNLETLEIEKQPEFKDGDILCVIESSNNYHYILIYEGQDDEHIYPYVTMLENNSLIIEKGSYFTKPKDYSMRYATEEEKQQLFDALEKEGKAWDAEKKQIVDLKPKCEFKPFDKVLVRHQKTEEWSANIFSHTDKTDEYLDYVCVNGRWEFCIPYNKETAHLLGTTDDWEGGEQRKSLKLEKE